MRSVTSASASLMSSASSARRRCRLRSRMLRPRYCAYGLLLCPFSLPTRNRPSTSTQVSRSLGPRPMLARTPRDRLADGLGGRLDHRQQRPSRIGVGLEAKLNVVAGMLHGSVGLDPGVE